MDNPINGGAPDLGQPNPGTAPQAAPPDPTASVDLTAIKLWTVEQLQRMRNFRRPYDTRRSYYYRQYIGQRDRKLYPDNLTPRSNTFVPYAASDTEAMVSRIQDAFFSIDPPIEVRAKGGTDDGADAMRSEERRVGKEGRSRW